MPGRIMTYMVREFKESDATHASNLLREAFEWFHEGNEGSWLWRSFEPSNLVANSEVQEILVAIDEETQDIVGYITSTTTPYGVAYIPTVAVRASLQRQGIGRLILDEKLRRLREKGMRKVWLLVTSVNGAAISFYLKNRFFIEGYLRDHTGPGYDEVLFSKFL